MTPRLPAFGVILAMSVVGEAGAAALRLGVPPSPGQVAVDLSCSAEAPRVFVLQGELIGAPPTTMHDPRIATFLLAPSTGGTPRWSHEMACWEDAMRRFDFDVLIETCCPQNRAWIAMTWSEGRGTGEVQLRVQVLELDLASLTVSRTWNIRRPWPPGYSLDLASSLVVADGRLDIAWSWSPRAGTQEFVLSLDPTTGTWMDRTAEPVVVTSVRSISEEFMIWLGDKTLEAPAEK